MLKSLLLLFIICTNFSFSQITLQNAFPDLNFDSALFLTNSSDGTNRIFVVEQSGIIKVFPNSSNAVTSKTFLDITVSVASGGELGLLGLAFHPNYETNGYFYVNYTADNPLRTIISRFQVTSNPDSANKNSEFELLTFTQPYSNHNGGWIGFGPNDGYLYIATGDGGSSGDPQNNAQRINTLLGKILRIDVDNSSPYAIPPTNPFHDSTNVNVRKEIYAWGLRNPWRCSFDHVTGLLYAGDVGQGDWEEMILLKTERIMAGDATKEIILIICQGAIILNILSRSGNTAIVWVTRSQVVMFIGVKTFPNFSGSTSMRIILRGRFGLFLMMVLLHQQINCF
jgi:hypothetical protein